MSNTDPRAQFDYKSWFDRHVAERTVAALSARDAAFAEKHAETPLPSLARYLARWGQTLHHSPSPCEVDGGEFIAQRFGGWDAALRAACLPPPRREPKLKDTARYQKEKKIQTPLFYEESERRKQEKRARAAQRRAQQEARLNEKKKLEQKKKLGEPPHPCKAQQRSEPEVPEIAV